MATKLTSCPQCHKQIKVPAEVVGKKIKCKGCNTVFVVEVDDTADATGIQPAGGPGAKPPAAAPSPAALTRKPAADDDDDGDGQPYGVTDLDLTPRCPHCAHELDDEDQVVCLNCGYNMETRELGRRKRVKEPTGMDWFLWLLPAGLQIALFMLCASCLLNRIIIFFTFDRSEYDNIERSGFNCCILWTSILCIWLMWWSGKNAFMRLVFKFRPPEEELH